MARVEFDDVTVAVDGTIILRDVSLDIGDGEFVGVIGPSGSGKTTLIRTVAGFTDVVAGRIHFDGVDVTRTPTADRDVGMVFQSPVLFATRSVRRNVAFPLELRRRAPEEIRDRVDAEVRAMHLEHLLGRRPDQLSSGEAQLVQIARAMVRMPRVLLLDEPFSTLDAARHGQLRTDLAMLQTGYGVTTLMATNDPADALTMPARLVVVDDGRIVQVDTPTAVRREPATIDAAVATGECWLFPATVSADRDGFWLTVMPRIGSGSGSDSDPVDGVALRHRAWSPALADRVGRDVTIGIRPEDVSVSSTGTVEARVTKVVPGGERRAYCDVGGWRCSLPASPAMRAGDDIRLVVGHVAVFDAATRRSIA